MKKRIALFLALICALSLAGCKQDTHLKIGQAASISIYSGLSGDSVLVTDAGDIAYITDNFNAIAFEKGRMPNEGENGFAYSLSWYDENQTRIASLNVMDEYTVVYDGRYYNGMEVDHEIDTERLHALLEAKNSEPIPNAPEGTWGVTMSVKDAAPTGLTLVITHSGEVPNGQLETGSPYWLEVWNDGVWNLVPELPVEDGIERAWTMEAWLLPTNDSREVEVHFEWIYGELPAGQYRIGKEVMLFRGTGDYEDQTYYAEFVIE